MELAIINGTYRDSSIKAVATAAGIHTELFWLMGACLTSYVPFCEIIIQNTELPVALLINFI